jgi:hypothetical protein
MIHRKEESSVDLLTHASTRRYKLSTGLLARGSRVLLDKDAQTRMRSAFSHPPTAPSTLPNLPHPFQDSGVEVDFVSSHTKKKTAATKLEGKPSGKN